MYTTSPPPLPCWLICHRGVDARVAVLQVLEYLRTHRDWDRFNYVLRRFQDAPRAILALIRHIDHKGLLAAALDAGVADMKDAKTRFEAIKRLPGVEVIGGGPCQMLLVPCLVGSLWMHVLM